MIRKPDALTLYARERLIAAGVMMFVFIAVAIAQAVF